ITAAKAITELLDADVGPIVVAGTLWTTSLMRMRDRPDPDMAAVGAGAITTLIGRATVVGVPDTFTNTDLENADVDDSRLQLAIRTATHTDHPYGRKIIQVLAGGTQLLHRTHPPDGTHPPDEFSPGAKALLHAAGDLRRIGMPNPLPRWALDGAAPAYLNPPDDPTPLDQWLPAAFTETTDADNPRTRTYSRDHYRHGVPALTPHWTTGPDGEPVEAYDLHDYLTQDHLTRHRYTPTKPSLWTCLTTQALTPDVDGELADAANDRGLLTTAITLLRPHANVVDDMRAEGLGFSKWLVRNRLASLLADRGDHNALVELRARAEAGDACAKGVLADSAGRVGVDALGESHADAENGQRRAQDRLAALLVRRAEGGDGHALNQLRRRAETGRGYAQDQLAALLARRAGRGDVGALNELRSRANADDRSALDWLIRLLADRAELGDNGALTELHALTGLDNPDARGRLTRLLADRAGRGHDVALGVLRCCVLAGYGGRELLHVHRARSSGSHVLELDYNANPVYER
ncbi:MAG: hypothetical protein KDB60_09000, partial [Propionibacteriaceae bacterium]|nr:hypothetical protein [Propionibacteriaceae bacterium]